MVRRVRPSSVFCMFLALAIVLATGASAQAAVRYVDAAAPAGGDGTTWATAHSLLQDALTAAGEGDEIRVAQGVYKPDRDAVQPAGSGDRAATFQMKNGVTIQGGYAGGTQPDPDTRDADRFAAILSGDLAGDDGQGFANYGDNAYHVVTGNGCDTTAVLDGVTVTAGNADGPIALYQMAGGGLLNEHGSPTIRHCRFEANMAIDGGAISCNYSHASITDCRFVGNTAVGTPINTAMGVGGAVQCRHAELVIERCLFEGNTALKGGGLGPTATSIFAVSDCTFRGNQADGSAGLGGGMYVDASTITVKRCLFESNTAISGGGLAHASVRGTTLVDCGFAGNVATDMGGAVRCISPGSVIAERCRFTANHAGEGGGLSLGGAPLRFRSCLVADNTADFAGAGISLASSLEMSGCTVANNATDSGYGGALMSFYGTLTLRSSVFWGNRAAWCNSIMLSRMCVGVSKATMEWCDVEGGMEGIDVHPDSTLTWGEGNTDGDPCFVDVSRGDYRLAWPSPCINGGDPGYVAAVSETDVDGVARVLAERIDIGACEYQPAGDLNGDGYVDVVDLLTFVDAWGSTIGDANYNAAADLNDDEAVDTADLLILVGQWGQPQA